MKPKFSGILHLGIVVRDLNKAVGFYEKELGIGPWEIDDPREFFQDKIANDTNGLQIKTATCKALGYEIELVQPVGPGIYQDWLDKHGPGMHHVVMETTESFDGIVSLGEKYSDNSHYMDAVLPDGKPIVSYVDMRESMGVILEIDPEKINKNK